ncbi:MAG: DUF4258 domain-containing protein [Burkholderiales bacterium]|nr:DUF4258 domain-containing protein [Anaerolineae bacterium]
MQRQRHHEVKNAIFTHHAQERMKLRRISDDMVLNAISKPDRREQEDDGDTKFIKTISGRPLHVVAAHLPDEKKWLVKSVWVRGENDPQPIWKRILLLTVSLIRRLLR